MPTEEEIMIDIEPVDPKPVVQAKTPEYYEDDDNYSIFDDVVLPSPD